MMRYRAKSYTIKYIAGNIFAIHIPSIPVTLPSDTTEATSVVREAIRLVIDETAKVVYCSSMQKDRLHQVSFNEPGYVLSLLFVAPEGKLSGITNHEFTVEFDFGEIPLVKSDLSDLQSAINAHTSNERETIMGAGTGEIADNVIDTQGLLIPGFTAVSDGFVYYCVIGEDGGSVVGTALENNKCMYTGAPTIGTCLRIDSYADIVTQELSSDILDILAIPVGTTGEPYSDGIVFHNIVTEPMALGKTYRLKSIVPIADSTQAEVSSLYLYIWEEVQSTGRNIAETYNLVQETSQSLQSSINNTEKVLRANVYQSNEEIAGGKILNTDGEVVIACSFGANHELVYNNNKVFFTDTVTTADEESIHVGIQVKPEEFNPQTMGAWRIVTAVTGDIVIAKDTTTGRYYIESGVTVAAISDSYKYYCKEIVPIHYEDGNTSIDGVLYVWQKNNSLTNGKTIADVYDIVEEVKAITAGNASYIQMLEQKIDNAKNVLYEAIENSRIQSATEQEIDSMTDMIISQ